MLIHQVTFKAKLKREKEKALVVHEYQKVSDRFRSASIHKISSVFWNEQLSCLLVERDARHCATICVHWRHLKRTFHRVINRRTTRIHTNGRCEEREEQEFVKSPLIWSHSLWIFFFPSTFSRLALLNSASLSEKVLTYENRSSYTCTRHHMAPCVSRSQRNLRRFLCEISRAAQQQH